MSTKEKSTFSHFFKEDAEAVQDIIYVGNGKDDLEEVKSSTSEIIPKIKIPKEVNEADFQEHWRKLRSFFRNGNNMQGLATDLVPVVMAPLYNKTIVGTDFPIWVADENYEGDGERCLSLKEILKRNIYEIGPGEKEAHILKENTERFLHIANELLADKKPQLFQNAINKVIEEFENQLDVSGDEVHTFNSDIKKLKNLFPKDGILLPYSNHTSLQLLEAAMGSTIDQNRKKLKHDIKQLKCRLNDLLRVEREKGPERKKPDKLKDSLSFADSMMDFGKLSSILPEAGSESIGEERVQRISSVVKKLEENEYILDQCAYLFVDETLHKNSSINWKNLFENAELKVYKKGKGCDTISASFEQHITDWTNLFAAKRIGELEFGNKYIDDIHDDYFEHFNWQSLSEEEINNCPHFILIADDIQLFETEFSKLSAIFSESIPVKIVAVKREEQIDFSQNGSLTKKQDLHTHAELGGLMLSHRNIYVAQSTSITPKYLFDGFCDGLASFSPSFFYILSVDENIHKNAYLWTSAKIEGRDFPGFIFKGLLGTPWGSRFKVENNPQAELSWPLHTITIIGEDGNKMEMEFPFTYADQAVMNQTLHLYFLKVNSSCWSDSLVPLYDYILNSEEENIGKVPFIWMVDGDNVLQKVAVSWQIVLATQERLDFWRFLQENSGINNYHVSLAVDHAKADMKELHEKNIEQLKAENLIEIQKVRDEEAGRVMENLTNVLLNLDTTNVIRSDSSVTNPKPVASKSENDNKDAVVEAKETAKEESLLSNDPYIDTALCTSCNECTEMNGSMFKYNADKMAYIANPKAGTFSELVLAAEKCPVSIIHPGTPLNPNEPDLESLVVRAEKYN